MFDYPAGSPGWRFTSSGGTYSGAIFLNSNGTWSSSTSFDLAFEVGIVPEALPVELTDFQATLTEEHTTFLSWQTASEKTMKALKYSVQQMGKTGKLWISYKVMVLL